MKVVLLSKLISVTPDANTGLVTQELHITAIYHKAPINAIMIRHREQAILVTMSKHEHRVTFTDSPLDRTIGACLGDMHRDIPSLLIEQRKELGSRVIRMYYRHHKMCLFFS